MATTSIARLLVGCRAVDAPAFRTWWQANIDPAGAETFSAGLSTDGALPAVAYVCCVALTAAQLRTVLGRLCQMAGLSVPAAWSAWTRDQRRDWARSQIPALVAGVPLRVLACDDNDGVWDDYPARVGAAGLQFIRSAL